MANNNMELANAKETANLFADGFGSFYSLFYGQDASAATGGRFDNWNDYIASRYSWDGKSSYDWIDAITRHGYYQDYNLSASGRVGQTGYYASMGYLNTEGLVIGTDMERFSGRLNLDSKFKFLTVGANTSYSYSIQNGNSESLSGSINSPATLAISAVRRWTRSTMRTATIWRVAIPIRWRSWIPRSAASTAPGIRRSTSIPMCRSISARVSMLRAPSA